jgi:hypothetical protein
MKRLLLIILALALAGCASDAAGPTTAPSAKRAQSMAELRAKSRAAGRNAAGPMRVRVDVYHLQVPHGTISRNDDFWTRVDEQIVDPATYDLLFRNGVRVGQAPIAEWEHFRQMIADQPSAFQASSILGPEAKNVDLNVRKQVEMQDIFYFDGSGSLQGRTYDRCENYLTISFLPAPRKPGSIRVGVCPVVKTMRKRLEISEKGSEREITYTHPERIYDCNLRSDIPAGSFMIIAPSAEAVWPTSIGSSFLLRDGPTERLESVLLLVPNQATLPAPADAQE